MLLVLIKPAFFAPSGGASSSGGGLVDLREGGLFVPAGGRGKSVRALEGRARLLSTLRHPRDHAGTGNQRYCHSSLTLEFCIGSSHASGPYIPILCSKRAGFFRAALYMLYRAKFAASIPLFGSNMSKYLDKIKFFCISCRSVINLQLSRYPTSLVPYHSSINGHVTHEY